jgi:hypothetical protein
VVDEQLRAAVEEIGEGLRAVLRLEAVARSSVASASASTSRIRSWCSASRRSAFSICSLSSPIDSDSICPSRARENAVYSRRRWYPTARQSNGAFPGEKVRQLVVTTAQ